MTEINDNGDEQWNGFAGPELNLSVFRKLIVKRGLENYLVPLKEIVCIYSENRVTFVKVLSGAKYIIDKPLIEAETNLNDFHFLRVSRNMLINIHQVEKFRSAEGGRIELYMQDKSLIPISQFYASNFRQVMKGLGG